MTATRSARQRKLEAYAGDLAKVKVEPTPRGLRYKITCTSTDCHAGHSVDSRWSTLRQGRDNGYVACVERWALHLARQHPTHDAPCLDRLAIAKLHADQERAYVDALAALNATPEP